MQASAFEWVSSVPPHMAYSGANPYDTSRPPRPRVGQECTGDVQYIEHASVGLGQRFWGLGVNATVIISIGVQIAQYLRVLLRDPIHRTFRIAHQCIDLSVEPDLLLRSLGK
jgi:hypothetical protein